MTGKNLQTLNILKCDCIILIKALAYGLKYVIHRDQTWYMQSRYIEQISWSNKYDTI